MHVVAELGPELRVIDGGACEVGIESTIIDCSRDRAVLLRPGTLTRSVIEAVLGSPLEDRDAAAPRAPGTLESHYAPRARVRLMSHDMLRSSLTLLASVPADPASGAPLKLAVYSRLLPPAGAVAFHQAMPARADQAAHELFTVLRRFDDLGAQLIWVEEPPATAEWDGVRDRLLRASAA
jgi:L-threonylcarbamoyladenylate synthase